MANPLSAFILFQIVLFSYSDIHVLGTKIKKNRSRTTSTITMMKTCINERLYDVGDEVFAITDKYEVAEHDEYEVKVRAD